MHRSISIANISLSRNLVIKVTDAKSVTDASLWVMFTSKNSDMLEIAEHSLFNSHIIIRCCGFHFSSTDLTDPIHRNPGQFVNKPRFCDRALLK